MNKLLILLSVILCVGCAHETGEKQGLIAYNVPEAWITDKSTGCKINRYYVPDATSVIWQGPCIDGYAIGKGTLTWVDSTGSKGFHRLCLQPDHRNSECFMGSGGIK